MKKKSIIVKHLKRIIIGIVSIFILIIAGLAIYSSTSYKALPEMDQAIDAIDFNNINRLETNTYIKYDVLDPKANIIFIPGGLVSPKSYEYLAAKLAEQGYNVTIVKALFNLAILTPNASKKYIDPNLENIIIGHSLGGVVASMVASKNEAISKIIMLGSYPIKDITSQESLFITAEHDMLMDQDKFDDSLMYVNEQNTTFEITGGNHAQFGWYGPQKGDGKADITTLEQQNIVVSKIIEFLDFDTEY